MIYYRQPHGERSIDITDTTFQLSCVYLLQPESSGKSRYSIVLGSCYLGLYVANKVRMCKWDSRKSGWAKTQPGQPLVTAMCRTNTYSINEHYDWCLGVFWSFHDRLNLIHMILIFNITKISLLIVFVTDKYVL